eukprot:gnl/TRDRNA2_/TRDRNA2_40808_c0_seq1.p1 gnl/TRDRNA2_/TRDRNA2_40808_c0~~gnl/TRDRNA2_/TRDRNA2_40808_c0_seq1.p1  ORF type:complete len:230 (+),score=46.84 gnl/TRDRNA2_/TRDRNA2_40808_c0_seq1:129-818(+)
MAEYPYPGCLKSGKFRVRFGCLVQEAQREVFENNGFVGPTAVSDMMRASRDTLSDPAVKAKIARLDELLRVTRDGAIMGVQEVDDLERAVVIRPAPLGRVDAMATAETVRKLADVLPPVTVRVPPEATLGVVMRALGAELGLDWQHASTMKFVVWDEQGHSFKDLDFERQLGNLRELLVRGCEDAAGLQVRASLPEGQQPPLFFQSAYRTTFREQREQVLFGSRSLPGS